MNAEWLGKLHIPYHTTIAPYHTIYHTVYHTIYHVLYHIQCIDCSNRCTTLAEGRVMCVFES